MTTTTTPARIVLVHGGFVDGSGWKGVYDLLTKDGYDVAIVQNPTLSLEGDVAATQQALDADDKPVVLVGHSYGGVVVTEAGNDPKVQALVYVAAFVPDKGESVGTLIADPPPGAPVPPILPPQNGFLFLDRDQFAASFAADLPPDLASFMADSQLPWGVGRTERSSQRTRLASSAELGPRLDRRPDDPAARAARHGRACRCHDRRGRRQSRGVRLPAQSGRRT